MDDSKRTFGRDFLRHTPPEEAVRVPGTIVGIHWETVPRRHGRRARVLLDYALADGRIAQAWSTETSVSPAGRLGQQLDVLYDPSEPGRVRIA